MNRRTLLAASAILSTCEAFSYRNALAQPLPMRRGPPPAPQSSGDTARLPLQTEHPSPVVEVTIAGRKLMFTMVTGAMGMGLITPSAAQTLGLTQAGIVRISDPSGKNPREMAAYEVPELSLGAIRFGALELIETPKTPAGLDGILGIDLFQKFILSFDRRTNQMEIVRGTLPAADGKTIFESPPGPAMRIPVRIGEIAFDAALDTGQSIWPLLVPEALTRSLRFDGPPKSGGQGRTVSQVIDMTARKLVDSVSVGSRQMPISEVAWSPPHPVANLGWKALEGLRVEIDTSSRTCRFA